jgi:hypothetical protein
MTWSKQSVGKASWSVLSSCRKPSSVLKRKNKEKVSLKVNDKQTKNTKKKKKAKKEKNEVINM